MFLANFQIAKPASVFSQEESLRWISEKHKTMFSSLEEQKKCELLVRRFSCKPSQLHSRGSWNPIYLERGEEEYKGLFSNLKLKNRVYQSMVFKELNAFYSERSDLPSHFIHTTCTGYASPSVGQMFFSSRSSLDTQIIHAYHMGCYAAIPSLQIAEGLIQKDRGARVDLFHSELCSLQFSPGDLRPEQIVIQSLFADGICLYEAKAEIPGKGFEVLHLSQHLLPDTLGEMTWVTDESGFYMTLSREVPAIIKKNVQKRIQAVLESLGLLLVDCVAAIHPGGPKILDMIQETLGLQDFQTKHSYDLFMRRGNMSSATLPHIWKDMLDDQALADDTPVISLAFGPGLTLCVAVMKKRVRENL